VSSREPASACETSVACYVEPRIRAQLESCRTSTDETLACFRTRLCLLCRTDRDPRQGGVAGLNSNLATLIRTIVILAVTAAIVSFRKEWAAPQSLQLRPVAFLIFSGIATGLSWLCYYRALQLAPASLVAPIDKLSVAFAIALGVLVLGEPFTWQVVLGGVLGPV
jgi:transporter family protein